MSLVAFEEQTSSGGKEMRLREHKGITEGRIDILFCKPGQLKIEPGYNVRDLTTPLAREKLDALKLDVKEHGVQTPLKVRFDGENIFIVEGHRRHMVALELISEHKSSKGAEGREIEAVPIYAEAKGTSELDRDFGLRSSNSGEQLEPLEFANLIYRTIHQRGISEQEAAKGFSVSITVLRNHLAMRAMPEDVKDLVHQGMASATHAARLVREQPEFAAELIKADADEKKLLGKKGRATPKGTRKQTAKRNPPKPAEPKAELQSAPEPAAAVETVSALPPIPETFRGEPFDASTDAGREIVREQIANSGPAAAEQPETSIREIELAPGHRVEFTRPRGINELFEAIAPIAAAVALTDLNEVADDDTVVIQISGSDAKRFSLVYTKATGDDVRDQAA